MDPIDGALMSMRDSLKQLATRLLGIDPPPLQLSRAGFMLAETHEQIVAARVNGTVHPGWGDEFVEAVNAATMLVAIVPEDTGPPFQRAMQEVADVLSAILAALPQPIA